MDGIIEILTGRERRRRWSTDDKLHLISQTHELGTTIGAVAVRHSVCESLLYTWRQVREGALTTAEMPAFLPVRLLDPPRSGLCAPSPPSLRSIPVKPSRSEGLRGMIEIELGNARQLRVGSDVNLAALRRVLAALGA